MDVLVHIREKFLGPLTHVTARPLRPAHVDDVQDDIRRKKLALERVNSRRAQIDEKLSDVNLQLDNADREQKRVTVKKQVSKSLSAET